MPNTNTIREIQASDTDCSIDSDDNENYPMVGKAFPIW